MTSKSSSASAPRKFSEKIALLKQKEAETTANFQIVMKDVQTGGTQDSPGSDSFSGVSSGSPLSNVSNTSTPSVTQPMVSSIRTPTTNSIFSPSNNAMTNSVGKQERSHVMGMQQQAMPPFMVQLPSGRLSFPPATVQQSEMTFRTNTPNMPQPFPQQQLNDQHSIQPRTQQWVPPSHGPSSGQPMQAGGLFGSYLTQKTASLPNVSVLVKQQSEAARNNSTIDLQNALSSLERMKSGREVLVDHLKNKINKHHHHSSGSNTPSPVAANPSMDDHHYSPQHSPRHHTRARSDHYQQPYQHGRAPYASPYLCPPPAPVNNTLTEEGNQMTDNWRRTASDSAIHQNVIDQQQQQFQGQFGGPTNFLPSQQGQMSGGPVFTGQMGGGLLHHLSHPHLYQTLDQHSPQMMDYSSSQQQSGSCLESLLTNNGTAMGMRRSVPSMSSAVENVPPPPPYTRDSFPIGQSISSSGPTMATANHVQGHMTSQAEVLGRTPVSGIQQMNQPMNRLPPAALGPSRQGFRGPPLQQQISMGSDYGDDLFNQIPDIILTGPEMERRDSFNLTNEVLSGLAGPSPFPDMLETDVSLLDISENDLQILTDPNMVNYVTDDVTEQELLQEQRFQQL